jgi:hypothetical protein
MPHRAIAQVTLFRDEGIPEDSVTNTWHFEADDDDTFDARVPGLVDRLADFYLELSSSFSAALAPSFQIKIYDWEDPPMRIPKSTTTHTWATGAGAFPSEVATCLTFEAERISGVSQASRRGRVFLGPLNSAVSISGGRDVTLPEASCLAFMEALSGMMAGGGGAFRLAVFSPTILSRGGTADEAWNDVVEWSMDNAFDTMRSRGSRPTQRYRLPA